MTRSGAAERVIPLCLLLMSWVGFSAHADDALIKAGETQAMVCKACNQFEPDGQPLVGPPLWGLADRKVGGYPDFKYSEALKGRQGHWDAKSLDSFLTSPADFAPGTNMVFPGVADPGARAAIIAWLATKNPSPPDWTTQSAGSPVKSVGDGILTPGDNMALVASVCSACHSLHLVKQQGLSRDSWQETLEWMVDEQGMEPLEPEDLNAVLDYLATYYGR